MPFTSRPVGGGGDTTPQSWSLSQGVNEEQAFTPAVDRALGWEFPPPAFSFILQMAQFPPQLLGVEGREAGGESEGFFLGWR